MSSSNMGEDEGDQSPSSIIIQLAQAIQELHHQDRYTNQEAYNALESIIMLAQKHKFITGVAGAINRLELKISSSISGIT